MEDSNHAYAELESLLGYEFFDKELLATALTNPSYKSDHSGEKDVHDNQRLEFLGDAVFGLLSAEQVFYHHTGEDEGCLTMRRSHLASGAALARLARQVGLGAYLILGHGEEMSGGREKDKYLTDTMEAIFGAAWCDGGMDAVREIYNHLNVGQEWTSMDEVFSDNPKGKLQEFCQRKHWGNPEYVLVSVDGPSHLPNYLVRVIVSSGASAEESGRNKHLAEAAAAQKMLIMLREAEQQRKCR